MPVAFLAWLRRCGLTYFYGVASTVWIDVLLCSRTGVVNSLAYRQTKVVGKPYEPHVRFDVAGGGDQAGFEPSQAPPLTLPHGGEHGVLPY